MSKKPLSKGERVAERLSRDTRGNRQKLSDFYEPPLSCREDWWRKGIPESPAPGTYEVDDTLKELSKKVNTFLSKTEGRKRRIMMADGMWLMPGAYTHEDVTKRLEKTLNTYSFRNTDRQYNDVFAVGDKDINLAPGSYDNEKYECIDGSKVPVTHYSLRSLRDRFGYKGISGPDPLTYHLKGSLNEYPPYASCFHSKTQRFRSIFTKVPGPGTYARTFQPIYTIDSTYDEYLV